MGHTDCTSRLSYLNLGRAQHTDKHGTPQGSEVRYVIAAVITMHDTLRKPYLVRLTLLSPDLKAYCHGFRNQGSLSSHNCDTIGPTAATGTGVSTPCQRVSCLAHFTIAPVYHEKDQWT
jgi:hypothetical protein